jgi:hypothetical protein
MAALPLAIAPHVQYWAAPIGMHKVVAAWAAVPPGFRVLVDLLRPTTIRLARRQAKPTRSGVR